MEDEYFSLQAILADNHKLSCSFTLDVPGLGYMEGGVDPNLRENTKVELPFWLAQTLIVNDFATFPPPPPYTARVKAALKASAPSVRLSALIGANGWWYRWGARIAAVLDDVPGADMLAMLLGAFTNRLAPLQDLSAHHASSDRSLSEGGSGSGEGFMDGMEGDERESPHESVDTRMPSSYMQAAAQHAQAALTSCADQQIFNTGQESGRLIKTWYDSAWGSRPIRR